jgi:hypothetical protein
LTPSIISRMVRCVQSLSAHGFLRAPGWRQAGLFCTPPMSVRWRHGVSGRGRAVSCPSSTTSERPRGGCTETLVDGAPRCSRSLKRCAQGARVMRAIQRPAGSKNDARAHLLFPTRSPILARLWNFATTSCSSLVPTTPKSAKGISCSLNSAGKRNITSPP